MESKKYTANPFNDEAVDLEWLDELYKKYDDGDDHVADALADEVPNLIAELEELRSYIFDLLYRQPAIVVLHDEEGNVVEARDSQIAPRAYLNPLSAERAIKQLKKGHQTMMYTCIGRVELNNK